MAGLMESIFIAFTLFGGWSFLSKPSKKRLFEQKCRSEPNTPLSHRRKKPSQSSVCEENEEERCEQSVLVPRTQPIAIKSATARVHGRPSSALAHSLGNSQRSTPRSGETTPAKSSTSSQQSYQHEQLWQQAFRNSCR
eukprot:gene19885-21826_t